MSESQLVECPYCQALTTVDESDFNKRLACPKCGRAYSVGDIPEPAPTPERWDAKGARVAARVWDGLKSAATSIDAAAKRSLEASAERENKRAREAARIAATPEAKLWEATWPYNAMTWVLVLGTLGFMVAVAANSQDFHGDNAYGATANAVRALPYAIGAGTCFICAFLCRVVIAIKRVQFGQKSPPSSHR